MTFDEVSQSMGVTLGLNNVQSYNSVEKMGVSMTFDEAVNYISEYFDLGDITYKSGNNYCFKGNRLNIVLEGSIDNCSLTFNVYNEGIKTFYCAWNEVFSLSNIEDYVEIIETAGVLDANEQTITIYDLLADLDDDVSLYGSLNENVLDINNYSNNEADSVEENFSGFNKESSLLVVPDDITTIRVVALVVDNKIYGYRFKTDKGDYDMRYQDAMARGLGQYRVEKCIRLISKNGLLMSQGELKSEALIP